jgi:hypothetical protein
MPTIVFFSDIALGGCVGYFFEVVLKHLRQNQNSITFFSNLESIVPLRDLSSR